MGTFLSNIQVFTGLQDSVKLLEELVLTVRDRLVGSEYEETDDAKLADRSLILQISSDRWISIYDQRLDEQDMDAMDMLGAAISARAGVSVVGSIVHDSDLLLMRLYRNGRTADTIINDLDLFNEMSEGSRPRKRNGLHSKWAEVCAHGVNPTELKAIWEKENVFAEDALALAAKLLDIPAEAAMRGYEIEHEYSPNTIMDGQLKVLHFRSKIRLSDYIKHIDVPKLAFTSWASIAAGDVGNPSTIRFGLTNQGKAFTGLDVLLWGPALDEQLTEPGPGKLIGGSYQFHTREEWSVDPQLVELEAEGSKINGYRYRYPEIAFPGGYMQVVYPETAAQLGLLNKWMEQFNQLQISFHITFTGKSVGKSTLSIGFVQMEAPENQLGLSLPVYIGVEQDRDY
ncbi:hypothetical protein [Cohnella abietis]|uniref:Uncharacterized protein n=1 Tax=Cohnella abietis TaxID=2507935 RepID=A0A3T1DD52_9BACL|nr:hypothetical protein [Cohnella abietis]BBI35875.1 hypothetical protein KCTCHS21_52740 [Cohnella abietis]